MGYVLMESSGTFNPADYGLGAGNQLMVIAVGGGQGGAVSIFASDYYGGKDGSPGGTTSFGSYVSARGGDYSNNIGEWWGISESGERVYTPMYITLTKSTGTTFIVSGGNFGLRQAGAGGWYPGAPQIGYKSQSLLETSSSSKATLEEGPTALLNSGSGLIAEYIAYKSVGDNEIIYLGDHTRYGGGIYTPHSSQYIGAYGFNFDASTHSIIPVSVSVTSAVTVQTNNGDYHGIGAEGGVCYCSALSTPTITVDSTVQALFDSVTAASTDTFYLSFSPSTGGAGAGYGAGGSAGSFYEHTDLKVDYNTGICAIRPTNATILSGGYGGNSGEVVQKSVHLTSADPITVTVGAGGAGGIRAAGDAGHGGKGADGCVAIFW